MSTPSTYLIAETEQPPWLVVIDWAGWPLSFRMEESAFMPTMKQVPPSEGGKGYGKKRTMPDMGFKVNPSPPRQFQTFTWQPTLLSARLFVYRTVWVFVRGVIGRVGILLARFLTRLSKYSRMSYSEKTPYTHRIAHVSCGLENWLIDWLAICVSAILLLA